MEKGNSMPLESSSKDNSNRSIKETMTMRVAKTRQNCGKLGQKSGKLCGKGGNPACCAGFPMVETRFSTKFSTERGKLSTKHCVDIQSVKL